MELSQKYFLTVLGNFEKVTLEYEEHPSENTIKEVILQYGGKTARIEKRYVLDGINEQS